MKNPIVTVALIIAASLLVSAFIVSAGLRSFGQSVEHSAFTICNGLAAQQQGPREIRIVNGNDGEYFRLQTRND